MFTKLKKTKGESEKGFTIIEVMIVLAIAGLILLIVFLAIPALQRNSRNTQRKNDVGNMLSAVSEYLSNNNGSIPTTSAEFSTAFPGVNPKLGYYTNSPNVLYNFSTTTRSTLSFGSLTPTDTVIIANNIRCNGNALTATGASSRSFVAYYAIETSSGSTNVCQDG